MDYTYRYEMEFNNTSVLRSPAEAYEAADEAEKARVRKLVQNMNLFKEEGENNMCSSVKAYGDEREARGIAIGEARAAETAKKYQNALAERDAENARLRAELEKYKSAEKRN